MVVSVKEQALIFLLSSLAGLGVGFLYDWFRTFFDSCKKKENLMGDAAFFIMAAFFLFWVNLHINDGSFRGFLWIGIVGGFFIYRAFFSRYVMKCSLFLVRIGGKILRFFLRILLFPLFLAGKLLRKPIITVITPARVLGKCMKVRYRTFRKEQKRKREIAKKIWKKI